MWPYLQGLDLVCDEHGGPSQRLSEKLASISITTLSHDDETRPGILLTNFV